MSRSLGKSVFVEDDATRPLGIQSGHVTADHWWQQQTGRDLRADLAGSVKLNNFDSTDCLFTATDRSGVSTVFLLSRNADGDVIRLCDNIDIVHTVREYLFEYGDELYLDDSGDLVSRTELEFLGSNAESYRKVTPAQVWERVLSSIDKPPDLHLNVAHDHALSDRNPLLVVEMSQSDHPDCTYETITGFESMAALRRYAAQVREAVPGADLEVRCITLADVSYLDREVYPALEPVNCRVTPPAEIVTQLAKAMGLEQQKFIDTERLGMLVVPTLDPSLAQAETAGSDFPPSPQETSLAYQAEADLMQPRLKALFNHLAPAAEASPDQTFKLEGNQFDIFVATNLGGEGIGGLEIYPHGSDQPLVSYLPGRILDVEQASLADLKAINERFSTIAQQFSPQQGEPDLKRDTNGR